MKMTDRNSLGKRSFVATLFFLFVSTNAQSFACFDVANLQQNIAGYLQEQSNFLTQIENYRNQMKLDAGLAQVQQETDENNAAGTIKALTEVQIQTTNQQLAARFDSLDNACDIEEENNNISQSEKVFEEVLTENSKEEIKLSTKSRTSFKQADKNEAILTDLSEPVDSVMSPSRFLGVGGTYSDAEVAGSQRFINYITRAYAEPAMPVEVSESSSLANKLRRADAVTKVLQHQIVRDAFNAVRIANLPLVETSMGEKISRLENIERFVESRFGSESAINFIALATNTHPDKNESDDAQTSDTEVLRMLAIMEAFSLHLQKLNYQEMLRQTQLSALSTQLLLERK